MKLKGINYDVGIQFNEQYLSRVTFDPQVTARDLAIIKNDLHCNAVRIAGTEIDRLTTAAELALKLGLEVWLSPHLHDKSPAETLQYTIDCAVAAEKLRQTYPNLVFILGCELTWFMNGIMKGDNFMERLGNPLNMLKLKFVKNHRKPLNAFLAEANTAVRGVFKGKVTYAAATIEAIVIDWSLFDFVALDYYRSNENRASFGERLRKHFAHNKPVVITEVGLCAYKGAEDAGARGFMIVDPHSKPWTIKGDYQRDEALQASELVDMLSIVEQEGVAGAFAFTFIQPELRYDDDPKKDLDLASYGIVKSLAGTRWEPKAAFQALADFYRSRKG